MDAAHDLTAGEVDVERTTSFVTALQEIKSLRPHLYSAAEYCEKSYLNTDQKEMILDNLKDYAARALVNTVDHLGTVACKLNDVLEQQALAISSIDLKVACLNQKLLTCRTYTDREGLRQQQLASIIPKHHKHYTLPNTLHKKVHFSPQIQSDSRQRIQLMKARLYPTGTSAARTLSWHLASETKSTLKGSSQGFMSQEESKKNLSFDSSALKKIRKRSTPATRVAMQTLGITRLDSSEGLKPPNTLIPQKESTPVHNKNKISSFFAHYRNRGKMHE